MQILTKSFKPVFILIVSALIFTLVRADESNPQNVLRIGAIAVLSGAGAAWGINHQRGTLLAVDQVNVAGGVRGKKIQVIYEDSPGGLAKNAVTAYLKLVGSDQVKFILGPVMMDELLAIAPIARRDGVFVGGATYMPNAPSNFFSTWIDADFETDLIAAHIFKKYKRVAVLSSQQSWESQVGNRFREAFKALGGQIVAFAEPSFEATEVKVEVLKLKPQQPEAVFISSYLLLSKYIQELKTLKIRVPVFGIELDQTAIDSAGKWAEGLVFIGPSAASPDFVIQFKEKWGVNPDIPAANAYDAAKLLFKAIAEGGEDISKVSAYFSDFKGYDGATGHIERRNGKTIISTSYYIVRKGKIERYSGEEFW